jgi:hypothetical protein
MSATRQPRVRDRRPRQAARSWVGRNVTRRHSQAGQQPATSPNRDPAADAIWARTSIRGARTQNGPHPPWRVRAVVSCGSGVVGCLRLVVVEEQVADAARLVIGRPTAN